MQKEDRLTAPPVVHVVDDDGAVRQSLAFLFDSVGMTIECHANPESFLESYQPNAPGCVIMDMRMPMLTGLQCLARLRELDDTIPVVILTAYGDVPSAVQAMQLGAMDFIEKPFSPAMLLERVQSGIALHRQRLMGLSRRLQASSRLQTLSDRERQVTTLLMAGKLNKQIAAELGISIKTVEAHRANIRHKLNVSTTAELVQLITLTS